MISPPIVLLPSVRIPSPGPVTVTCPASSPWTVGVDPEPGLVFAAVTVTVHEPYACVSSCDPCGGVLLFETIFSKEPPIKSDLVDCAGDGPIAAILTTVRTSEKPPKPWFPETPGGA